jgi:hypothetical protein
MATRTRASTERVERMRDIGDVAAERRVAVRDDDLRTMLFFLLFDGKVYGRVERVGLPSF